MTDVRIRKSKLRNPVDDGEREGEINKNKTQIWKPLGLTRLNCEFGFEHLGVHMERET